MNPGRDASIEQNSAEPLPVNKGGSSRICTVAPCVARRPPDSHSRRTSMARPGSPRREKKVSASPDGGLPSTRGARPSLTDSPSPGPPNVKALGGRSQTPQAIPTLRRPCRCPAVQAAVPRAHAEGSRLQRANTEGSCIKPSGWVGTGAHHGGGVGSGGSRCMVNPGRWHPIGRL